MNTNDNPIYKDIPINDNLATYYTLISYNKLHSYARYFNLLDSKFEANEIVPNIYLGAINSVFDYETLEKLGIRNVLSVLIGFEPPIPERMNYYIVQALDSECTQLCNVFTETNEIIDNVINNGEKILIHCSVGRSRSATIVIAYLIHKFGMNVETALKHVQNKRNIVEPNSGFLRQLNDYYDFLYSYSSSSEEEEEEKTRTH